MQNASPTFGVSDPHYLARIEWLADVRTKAADGQWKIAASNLSSGLDEPRRFETEETAMRYVREKFVWFLDQDRYLEAATLAWRRGHFDARPFHVQRVMNTYRDYDLIIFIGAAGLGKSLAGLSANFALDFFRDPENTTIKIASVSDTNLKGNIWAKINHFVSSGLFPIDCIVDSRRMRLSASGGGPDTGIDAILLGRGVESIGKLKGYHPSPTRKVSHPIFGDMTRLRIGVDEAPHVPMGVLDDLGSPRSSVNPKTHAVKIILTCNAVSENNWALREAEPVQGWREEYIDQLYDWDSPRGWRVCRLDSRVTENVRENTTVFGGFPERDSERQYLNGTLVTARWYTFWAGWPPPGKAADVVVPTSWFDQALGEPIFTGPVRNLAGLDPSYQTDTAVLSVGRYGLATGWIDHEGVRHEFDHRANPGEKENRHCFVLDELIQLESKDPLSMGREVSKWCETLAIEPAHLAADMTGTGSGTTSYLQQYWGGILAIHWKSAASSFLIMADDKYDARYHVTNKISEMYYTLRRWMEPRVRGFFINPKCGHKDKLKHQLTTRTVVFDVGKKGFDVEDKHKFKSRGNESPGEADATIMILQLIRERGFELPALSNEQLVLQKRAVKEVQQMADEMSDAKIALSAANRAWEPPVLDTTPVVIPDRLQR